MLDTLADKLIGAFTGMSTEEIVMVCVGFGG